MEECPKCGKWTLSVNLHTQTPNETCLTCGFNRIINADVWREQHNDLPKLCESLRLREKYDI